MKLNFFENLKKEIEKDIKKTDNSIENTELELAEKLGVILEFSIDRIEENIVILENRRTGESVQVEKSKLPFNIKEGDILKYISGKYMLDKDRTINEKERIKNKMDGLWK